MTLILLFGIIKMTMSILNFFIKGGPIRTFAPWLAVFTGWLTVTSVGIHQWRAFSIPNKYSDLLIVLYVSLSLVLISFSAISFYIAYTL